MNLTIHEGSHTLHDILVRVQETLWIEHLLDLPHHVDRSLVLGVADIRSFHDAYPCVSLKRKALERLTKTMLGGDGSSFLG
jgi:hypothetical protein